MYIFFNYIYILQDNRIYNEYFVNYKGHLLKVYSLIYKIYN